MSDHMLNLVDRYVCMYVCLFVFMFVMSTELCKQNISRREAFRPTFLQILHFSCQCATLSAIVLLILKRSKVSWVANPVNISQEEKIHLYSYFLGPWTGVWCWVQKRIIFRAKALWWQPFGWTRVNLLKSCAQGNWRQVPYLVCVNMLCT